MIEPGSKWIHRKDVDILGGIPCPPELQEEVDRINERIQQGYEVTIDRVEPLQTTSEPGEQLEPVILYKVYFNGVKMELSQFTELFEPLL